MCLHQVPAFNTWATAKFFLNGRDGAIPRVSLALRGGSGKDCPESWYTRDIVFRSQKETVFLAISFLLHPAVTNNRSHRGRCGAGTVEVTTDRQHRTKQSPIAICARVWKGWYSKALKPRNRGGGVLRLHHEARNEGGGHFTPFLE